MKQRPHAGGVFELTTTRPVAVFMAFLTLVLFGVQSLRRLPTNLLPDISYPRVTVRAEYPGAAPEDVEERVTKRLHEALSVLSGLESISSISRAGSADVTLEFVWGTQLTFSIQDIRERLDRTLLPLEVQTPIILRYDPTLDPVLSLGLTGGRDLTQLRRLGEDRLGPAISTVEGVAAVRVRGGLQEEIQVRLQGDSMASHGLTAQDVAGRLAAENVNLASGTVLEGDTEYLVRILNEYRHPDEIGRTIIKREPDGGVVRLDDLASIHRTHKKRDVVTRIGGQESVELLIFKEADANIVELASAVRDRVLGTVDQRRYVRQLRNGDIDDPVAVERELQRQMRAEPQVAALISQWTTASQWGGGGGRRGGGPGGGGGGGPRDGGGDDDDDDDGDDSAASPTGAASEESDAGAGDTTGDELTDGEPPPPTVEERAGALYAEWKANREALIEQEENFDYLAADLPSDVSVQLLSDQSAFIEKALNEVQESGLVGAFFAVIVLYLFLRKLGTTIIIAVAIPVSVLVTFVPLHMSNTTLNVMSLGGLALGIGMVVDNAIVVLESIARCRERGDSPAAAAVNGVREVAGAATASTLTTVAVFAPIIFVEGIAGQVFRDQALTVVASLMVSLVVALMLVPMLASRTGLGLGKGANLGATWRRFTGRLFTGLAAFGTFWIPRARLLPLRLLQWLFVPVAWPLKVVLQLLLWTLQLIGRVIYAALAVVLWLALAALGVVGAVLWLILAIPSWLFTVTYGAIHRAYPPFIAGVIGSPTNATFTLVIAAALMAWTLMTAGSLGSELLPEVHQGEITGRLTMPVGTPLQTTDGIARQAERAIADHPDVAWISVTVGVPRDEVNEPDEGEHTARLTVGLHPSKDIAAAEERVMDVLREALGNHPQLRDMRFERPSLFTVRSPLAVEITGDDLGEIGRAAGEVEAVLRGIPGLRDIQSSVQPGSPEVMISFDRDLISRYGLDTQRLANTVSNLVKGNVATRFTEDEHKLDVLVQMDKLELQSLQDLMQLPANPTSDASEPLSALADIRVREGPREIRRIWGQRAAIVSASLSGFDIGRAAEQISDKMLDIERRSDGLTISMSGQSREMDGALDQMTTALLLAVFLVYVVMASIFESLLQPLIIMVTVPLALFGAVMSLWLLDIPLSVVVFIGAIILAGIVVNNAIVLIDACNRRRRLDGMDLEQAVRAACEMRLRPILMTTLTTVLGLLPLTGLLADLGLPDWVPGTGGEGTELRAPMAITVVAGLLTATALTLVVIPTVYVLVERALGKRASQTASPEPDEDAGDAASLPEAAPAR